MTNDQLLPGLVAQLVSRATVFCSGGRGIESDKGQRFFSFSVLTYKISRSIAQKISFSVFIQHFNIPQLNNCTDRQTVTQTNKHTKIPAGKDRKIHTKSDW